MFVDGIRTSFPSVETNVSGIDNIKTGLKHLW